MTLEERRRRLRWVAGGAFLVYLAAWYWVMSGGRLP
jgi:hypothetical protein